MVERKKYGNRWVGVLEKTKVALRLINGGADPVSGAHMAARYEELIPNADIIVLPTNRSLSSNRRS
ncbi:MAG: alpha/beta hydrolase [bacterium]|nr:MAG: alpha/beta hydrolase [bacterium]